MVVEFTLLILEAALAIRMANQTYRKKPLMMKPRRDTDDMVPLDYILHSTDDETNPTVHGHLQSEK